MRVNVFEQQLQFKKYKINNGDGNKHSTCKQTHNNDKTYKVTMSYCVLKLLLVVSCLFSLISSSSPSDLHLSFYSSPSSVSELANQPTYISDEEEFIGSITIITKNYIKHESSNQQQRLSQSSTNPSLRIGYHWYTIKKQNGDELIGDVLINTHLHFPFQERITVVPYDLHFFVSSRRKAQQRKEAIMKLTAEKFFKQIKQTHDVEGGTVLLPVGQSELLIEPSINSAVEDERRIDRSKRNGSFSNLQSTNVASVLPSATALQQNVNSTTFDSSSSTPFSRNCQSFQHFLPTLYSSFKDEVGRTIFIEAMEEAGKQTIANNQTVANSNHDSINASVNFPAFPHFIAPSSFKILRDVLTVLMRYSAQFGDWKIIKRCEEQTCLFVGKDETQHEDRALQVRICKLLATCRFVVGWCY